MAKNRKEKRIKDADIIGKKVLILGESGSGKTKIAAELILELMSKMEPTAITVIDLAPKRIGDIGGKLSDYISTATNVRYFSPKNVYAPRLAGTSPEHVLRYAEMNRRMMEPLLDKFFRNVTEVLVINDVTLYLHSGKLDKILQCVRLARTFLATAYYGSKLAEDLGTGISSRERRLTDELTTFMDLVVKLD